MLSIPESLRIFVAKDPVDFRRQFDGLAATVTNEYGMDPLCGHVFVFFNKRRDRIKLLVFQHTGFWLHYKRLECGTFESIVAADSDQDCVEVDARKLRLLLDGIDLEQAKFRKHFEHALRIGECQYGNEHAATT